MYSYSRMLAVTNRHLCQRDFLEQIDYLAGTDVDGIILREKDLPEAEYEQLAASVLAVCGRHHKKCMLHTYVEAARRLGCPNIHLPLHLLIQYQGQLDDFEQIGASVHSVEDAVKAREAGATYLTAGHVFETDCKKGLPGRGIEFLKNVCGAVDIPVYGIGGITPENMPLVLETGAAGGCMMSLAMKII